MIDPGTLKLVAILAREGTDGPMLAAVYEAAVIDADGVEVRREALQFPLAQTLSPEDAALFAVLLRQVENHALVSIGHEDAIVPVDPEQMQAFTGGLYAHWSGLVAERVEIARLAESREALREQLVQHGGRLSEIGREVGVCSAVPAPSADDGARPLTEYLDMTLPRLAALIGDFKATVLAVRENVDGDDETRAAAALLSASCDTLEETLYAGRSTASDRLGALHEELAARRVAATAAQAASEKRADDLASAARKMLGDDLASALKEIQLGDGFGAEENLSTLADLCKARLAAMRHSMELLADMAADVSASDWARSTASSTGLDVELTIPVIEGTAKEAATLADVMRQRREATEARAAELAAEEAAFQASLAEPEPDAVVLNVGNETVVIEPVAFDTSDSPPADEAPAETKPKTRRKKA